MLIAGIHVLVGLILLGPFLPDIVRAGPGDGQAGWSVEMLAAFWFLIWSWPLFLLGYVAQWAQARTGRLPAALGWGLISVAAISVVFGPVSGLWLFIPLGVLALAAARERGQGTRLGQWPRPRANIPEHGATVGHFLAVLASTSPDPHPDFTCRVRPWTT